jgi:hypothetical protein
MVFEGSTPEKTVVSVISNTCEIQALSAGRPWRRRACSQAGLPSSNSRQGEGRHS